MPEPRVPAIPREDHELNDALRLLEAETLNFAHRFTTDARVREEYLRRARSFSEELRAACAARILTGREAATAAHQMRNELLELLRAKSSDVGRAWAEKQKSHGRTFTSLLEKYAQQKYGRPFAQISHLERKAVFAEITAAAGRPQARATAVARRLGAAGRGLWLFSVGIAVYNVSTADDKKQAVVRETVGVGGGFGGGAAGGAVAGLACGPGAPVCVAVGTLVGGILGAILADMAYDRARRLR